MEEELQRHPSRIDTDQFFETTTETNTEDSGMDTESDGWMQMLMPQDWYYDEDEERW